MTLEEVTKEVTSWGHISRIRYIVQQGAVDDILSTLEMKEDGILKKAIEARMAELGNAGPAEVTSIPEQPVQEIEVAKNEIESSDTPAVEVVSPVEVEPTRSPLVELIEAGAGDDAGDNQEDEPEVEDMENREVPTVQVDLQSVMDRMPSRTRDRQRINANAAYDMLEEILDAIHVYSHRPGATVGEGGAVSVDLGPVIQELKSMGIALTAMQSRISLTDERVAAIEVAIDRAGVETISVSEKLEALGAALSSNEEAVESISRDIDVIKEKVEQPGVNVDELVAAITDISNKLNDVKEVSDKMLEFVSDVTVGGVTMIKNSFMEQFIILSQLAVKMISDSGGSPEEAVAKAKQECV